MYHLLRHSLTSSLRLLTKRFLSKKNLKIAPLDAKFQKLPPPNYPHPIMPSYRVCSFTKNSMTTVESACWPVPMGPFLICTKTGGNDALTFLFVTSSASLLRKMMPGTWVPQHPVSPCCQIRDPGQEFRKWLRSFGYCSSNELPSMPPAPQKTSVINFTSPRTI